MNIDIYVPICLACFEDDDITLSDRITITRIPEEIQKSRQYHLQYESRSEGWISSCATHMICIRNYIIDNTETTSINMTTRYYKAYPLEIIDDVFAAIRIVKNISIGYTQILSRPKEWIDSFHADLIPLYGAKASFINPNEITKPWLSLPIAHISHEDAINIKKMFANIISIKESSKKAHKNRVSFALKRFNRCLLRNEPDDMTVDAIIGLESLLCEDVKAEISYTISNRIPIVFSNISHALYTQQNSRKIMKKLYACRSKIVHGSQNDKDTQIVINAQKFPVSKVAVDFLQYSLMFILEHPGFLEKDAFESYIDAK